MQLSVRASVLAAVALVGGAGPVVAAPGVSSITYRFYLAPRGGLAALERAVLAVSTPGSPRYGHFLTPPQFRARFGPTAAEVRAIRSAVGAAGGRVGAVEGHRRWVTATGLDQATVAKIAKMPDVLAVGSFDATHRDVRPGRTIRPPDIGEVAARRPGHPCSSYYGQLPAAKRTDGTLLPLFQGRRAVFAVCGYTARQLRSAYVGSSRLTGRGVTVAVVDPFASSTVVQDANTLARHDGTRPFRPGQLSQSLPAGYDFSTSAGCSDPYSSETEETLDVEAIHAIAPAANVRYYAAPRCDDHDDPGTIDALARVVDENRASFVSNSYGDLQTLFGAGTRAGYEQVALQAAMQGIGALWSSGDFGSLVVFPASDPWVTAVGGTSVAIDRTDRIVFQTGWETESFTLSPDGGSWNDTGPRSGSAGGFSTLYARPAYQRGVVPADSPPGRAYPDVSMVGNPTTGMRVGETVLDHGRRRYVELRIAGTSLSAPLMAAMEALAAQDAGHRLGWANPAIYQQIRRHAHTFNDITNAHAADANVLVAASPAGYTLNTLGASKGFGQVLRAAPGWDPVTGVGTPNQRYLVHQGR